MARSVYTRSGGALRSMTQHEQLLRGLLQGLVSYWDGSGGSCGADPIGGNYCSGLSGSAVAPVTGPDGNSISGIGTSPILQRAAANVTGLDFVSGSFTLATWFNTANSNQGLIARWVPSSSAKRWAMLVEGGVLGMACSTDGVNATAYAQTGSGLSSSTKHFGIGWRDTANNKVWIQLDNGTPISVTLSGASALYSTLAPNLALGALDTAGTYAGQANLARIGAWNRVLTDAERAALYNNGTGLTLRNIYEGR